MTEVMDTHLKNYSRSLKCERLEQWLTETNLWSFLLGLRILRDEGTCQVWIFGFVRATSSNFWGQQISNFYITWPISQKVKLCWWNAAYIGWELDQCHSCFLLQQIVHVLVFQYIKVRDHSQRNAQNFQIPWITTTSRSYFLCGCGRKLGWTGKPASVFSWCLLKANHL